MKIVFLRGTMTSAGNARSGHVVDLPDAEAKTMIRNGRASEYVEIPTIEMVDRSVGLEQSDDQPAKRRGRPRKFNG